MAKIVVMKAGVGDHPHELCPPHEAELAMQTLKRLQAQRTARDLMENALLTAHVIKQLGERS